MIIIIKNLIYERGFIFVFKKLQLVSRKKFYKLFFVFLKIFCENGSRVIETRAVVVVIVVYVLG